MANHIHGKNAVVYLAPGSGAAINLAEQVAWSLTLDFDLADVSQLGDAWASAVRGLGKWSGKLDGNFNIADQTLWSAATATVPSNFYLYPQGTSGTYYYGTVWVKLPTLVAGSTTGKAATSVAITGDASLSVH